VFARLEVTAGTLLVGAHAAHVLSRNVGVWRRLAALARTKGAISVGTFLVGASMGGGVGHHAGRLASSVRGPAPVAPSASTGVPPRAPEPMPPTQVEASASVAPSISAPLPRLRPTAGPAADERRDDLAGELALVQMARTAIARGNFVDALDAASRHERLFPRGHLAEERESLAIQALAGAGRGPEARARAERFHVRYPRSVLLPAVDASLRSIP